MNIYTVRRFSWCYLAIPMAFSLPLLPGSVVAASPWSVNGGNSLKVNDSYSSSEDNDIALQAQDVGSSLETKSSLNFEVTGNAVTGVSVRSGALANINQATLNVSGNSAQAVSVDGAQLNINGGEIYAEGTGATVIQALNKAQIDVNGARLYAKNGVAYGAFIQDSELSLNNSEFNIESAATGIMLSNNSKMDVLNSTINATSSLTNSALEVRNAQLTANNMTLSGAGNSTLHLAGYGTASMATANIKNSYLSGSGENTILAMNTTGVFDDVDIINTHEDGIAINVNNNANIQLNEVRVNSTSQGIWTASDTSSLTATASEFTTTGDRGIAVNAQYGNASLTDSKITTSGYGSYGIYTEVGVIAKNTPVSTTGDSAPAVLAARGGNIQISDSSLTTAGANSAGLFTFSGSTIDAEAIQVITRGDNSAAAQIKGGEQTVRNSVLSTEGNSAVISADDDGSISLSNTQMDSSQGGGIVVYGANLVVNMDTGSSLKAGNGILLSVMQDDSQTPAVATLNASDNVVLTGDAISDAVSKADLNLTQSRWTGAAQQANNVILNDSIWNISANSSVNHLSTVNSTVDFTQSPSWTTLTVHGDLSGGGLLAMKTQLGDDTSPTDQLKVEGNASGDYLVAINNMGGKGAATVNGIEVIGVQGDSTAASFNKQGRIVAGLYDYDLVRGKGDNSGRWYLVSEVTDKGQVNPGEDDTNNNPAPTPDEPNPIPDPDIDTGNKQPLPDPGNGSENNQPAPPTDNERQKSPPRIRSEAASYAGNIAAANTLFVTRMHDRIGEPQFSGDDNQSSLWLRQVGGHSNWNDTSGQLKTKANRYVAQLGADILATRINESEFILGTMVGYANERSHSSSNYSAPGSKGRTEGYSGGLYATWYSNAENREGLYVDSWLLYNRFKHTVQGSQLPEETYHSHGFTGSLESGYTLPVTKFMGSKGSINSVYLQPQIQMVWMGVRAGQHREDNGTLVKSEGSGNLQTRLGVRAFISGKDASDKDTEKRFQPFVEANWLHNSREFGVSMDDASISQDGTKNLAEVKLGVEAKLNNAFTMWGNTAVQMGEQSYTDASAMLGVKYQF